MEINRQELEGDYSAGASFMQMPVDRDRCQTDRAGESSERVAPDEVPVRMDIKAEASSEKALSTEASDNIKAKHRALWATVKKKLIRGLKRRDLARALEELKVAKVAAEVLTSMVKGERQAWGIDDSGREITPDDTEEIVKEMASLTIPSGADKTLDGE